MEVTLFVDGVARESTQLRRELGDVKRKVFEAIDHVKELEGNNEKLLTAFNQTRADLDNSRRFTKEVKKKALEEVSSLKDRQRTQQSSYTTKVNSLRGEIEALK